jgi:cyclase
MTMSWNRCLIVWALAAATEVPAAVDPGQAVTPTQVADGIVAFIAPESNSMLVNGNSVAIIGDDGVLVVDSGHFPSLTRRVIAEIRQRTEKPVRFVVNTHWHPDHVTGNAEYRRAFPGVTIVSTEYTRAQMAMRLAKYLGSKEEAEGYSTIYRGALRSGKNAAGQPLKPVERHFMEQEVVNGEILARERLWETPLTLPDATFNSSVSVYLGKREVRILWLGRGNTGGDAIIYVPDSRVVMTGDLVVSPTPYAYGSYLTEWRQTLHRLMDLDATAIVPGHGPVQRDWAYIKRLDALLGAVLAQVAQGESQGRSLADIRKTLDVEEFRRQFCGDDQERSLAFKIGFVEPATERAYQESKLADEE